MVKKLLPKNITLFLFMTICYIAPAADPGDKHELLAMENDSLSDKQILTDPSIEYDFGVACYYAGIPPKGREAIDRLVASQAVQTIKSVLNGDNNEGKVYAIEALLLLGAEGETELSEGNKEHIIQIIKQDFLIDRCQGCMVSSIRTLTLFKEKRFQQLLEENGIKI